MKAAVCYDFGKPLVMEDIELEPPGVDEVKVRIGATAVCHSDIHFIRGELGGPGGGGGLPMVAGHESAGYVEEVGKNITSVKPGDAVVVSLLKSCKRCYYCVNGLPHMCRGFAPQPPAVKLRNKQGQTLNQLGGVAGFAEYVTVHESQTAQVPDDMPIDRASLLACGVITGFGAVVNRAQVKALSSAVVIGTGGVGLNSIQGAAFSGAYPVIAVDILDSKLEAAKKFGATHTVRADNEEAVKQVYQLTSGRGADYVFVTVGSVAAVQQGVNMTGPRGMTVVVGLTGRGQMVSLPPLLPGEKVFTSCMMGATKLSTDIPKLVALYQAGRLKLDELITERYPLEKINEAIEAVEAGKALRNVIVFK